MLRGTSMIISTNYSNNHIRELQHIYKRDPILIEKTLYAFGLLEALQKVGLDFIFKGGTSLLLLLPRLKRLSTDIDIVVEPGTDIDGFVNEAANIFPFTSVEEKYRQTYNKISKRHFKFAYYSQIEEKTSYILLDVLFEECLYANIIEKEIKNDLLLTDENNIKVRIPSAECLLGDKLTAFAPYTTGVPLRHNKEQEVIKQFYDINLLINEVDDFENVRKTYHSVSAAELSYRNISAKPEDALKDTIHAAICIGSRGKISPNDYQFYLQGIKEIANHIFETRFSMEVASKVAPKIIYTAACLLSKEPFAKSPNYDVLKKENLINKELKTMVSFRKLNSGEYGYLVLADKLLNTINL